MNSQDTLIALWGAGFGVFMMQTMTSYLVPQKAKTRLLHVREADGSVLGVFSAPDVGKPAVEIIQALHWQTGQTGGLLRAVTGLDLKLQSMDVKECKKFLSQMKIKVISGQGWLEPSTTVQAEAFSWKPGTRMAMVARIVRYLDDLNVTLLMGLLTWQSREDLKLLYFFVQAHFSVGWVEQEINDKGMWKALVSLLALNIKNHMLKPWMVVTDLKDYLDGQGTYVCVQGQEQDHKRWREFGSLSVLVRPELEGEGFGAFSCD
ncbi:hypothetical protein SELMODRAFT_407277 [Selaginella moellendorffii]|uniref:Uncharacterized protein n=1 Tax=Selaginella moellendorffii TaxID=88036 RepID=D8R4H9_SELML|nr:hypothetical protein SELMODRAFT_407277 [Selaginella moellendorffii]